MASTLLIALYIACELIANITANKTILFLGVTAPGGVFIYALTFTLIDLINEHFGKPGARRVIYAAFAANILFALYSAFIVVLPSPSFFTGQEAFAQVLGSTPRIVAASLLAYMVSSLIDVEVFDAWKRRIGGYKWARVLASNAVSTAVDSSLFVAVAFGGSLPLLPLIAGQYLIKMAITVVSVPLIYATRSVKVGPAGE
ncbi:VUT family protein [bacterium]|nr:MAG: VUT family protein [bacterium]